MNAPIYSLDGKSMGTVALPDSIFGVRWNADLVKQVSDSLFSSRRRPLAHTKTRAEVRGGGRKPWRQKGTGRARHGSTRSPIWVGGGVAGGPRKEKNFGRKVPKKMKVKALYTILSRKFKDGEVLFIDSITFPEPKTKEAVKMLRFFSNIKGFENLFLKKRNAAVVTLSGQHQTIERAFRNLGHVKVLEARNIDPLTLLEYKYVVIENPQEAFKVLPGLKFIHA